MPKNENTQPKTRTRNVADGLSIDIDLFIETYNKNNPTLKPLTKKSLADELGVHPMVFAQWKKQAPYIVKCLIDLMAKGKCDLTDFVKQQPLTETLKPTA